MDGLKKLVGIGIPVGIFVAWIAANPEGAGQDTGALLDKVVSLFQAAGQYLGGVFS